MLRIAAGFGSILNKDDQGLLVSESSRGKLVPPWIAPVEDAVRAYVRIAGETVHSIYVRGSVSRGRALEGASDVDMLVVVEAGAEDIEVLRPQLMDASRAVGLRYPFSTGVDLAVYDLSSLLSGANRAGRVLLKLTSACVHGEDLVPALPGVKPGPEAVLAAHRLKRYLMAGTAITRLHAIVSNEHQRRGLLKRIVRTGFELVMEREQVFTRDLLPCYLLFSKYYPRRTTEMRRAMTLAISPDNDGVYAWKLVEELRPFLIKEIRRQLERPGYHALGAL